MPPKSPKAAMKSYRLKRFNDTPVIIIFLVLILPAFAVGALLYARSAGSEGTAASASEADCDIQHGGCVREVAGRTVGFDISPKPVRAMTDLTFRVSIDGDPPEAPPFIDLDMPDMFMGLNRVRLEPAGDGVYEGEGVIVRCPSGIPLWQATVTLPGVGEARFRFNVVY